MDAVTPPRSPYASMKVADLKKVLKTRGLPVSGNKTELIERLQVFGRISEKDFEEFGNSQFAHLNTEDPIMDSQESTLLLDDSLGLDYSGKLITDDSQTLTSTSEDTNTDPNTASLAKPLKKRAFAKPAAELPVAENKLQLNRTNTVIIPAALVSDVQSPVLPKAKTMIFANDKNENKTIPLKTMTQSDRLAMRAKRFNVSDNENKVVQTRSTPITSTPITQVSKPTTLSNATNTTDLNILKKRAERFGQNVSTVMRQIEEKEKLLKRKLKFGASAAISGLSTLDDQERKKRRAERFGMA